MRKEKKNYSTYVKFAVAGAGQILFNFFTAEARNEIRRMLDQYFRRDKTDSDIDGYLKNQNVVALLYERLDDFKNQDAEFIEYVYREPIKNLDCEDYVVVEFADGSLLSCYQRYRSYQDDYPFPESVESFIYHNFDHVKRIYDSRVCARDLDQAEKNWLYLLDKLGLSAQYRASSYDDPDYGEIFCVMRKFTDKTGNFLFPEEATNITYEEFCNFVAG